MRLVAKVVIDASAMLALLNGEKGAEVVAEVLADGVISSVNLSEVVAKLCDTGVPEDVIRRILQPLGLEIEPFDEEQAYLTGLLIAVTRSSGISLGDRACLSLAKKLNAVVLTADKTWMKLSVGATIRVIR